jgi:hypothetical protein
MSYESKLYVVIKAAYYDTTYPRFCWQIAQYDLGGCPEIAKLFQKDNPNSECTDCGLYLDGNGNKQVIEDCYGSRLREANIETVIDVLKSHEVQSQDYQRLPPLLAMLESFRDNLKNVVVIHFGH